jgi:hypothetical protein
VKIVRPAPWAVLVVAVAACLGDPVGPGILVVAVEGAGPDTVWLGAPGEPVPAGVRLRITDDAGRPLPGASLTWEAVGRDARVVAPSAESNSAGLATAGWQLGTDAAEEQRLHVLVRTPRHHSEVVIRARAVPHIVSQIRVLIDTPAVVRLGDSLPVAVNAIDPYGNVFPAPDVTRWVTDSGVGAIAGQTFIGGPHRGWASVGVASHGVAASFPVRVTQYVAAIVPVSDTLRFSALGAQRRVAYVVRDDRGRTVADTTVAIAAADTGVAQLKAEYVRALTPGLTALRLTLGPAAATIVVDVQQRIGSLRLARDTIRLDALMDTTTVTPIVHDSLGSPIPNPVLDYNVSDARVAKFAATQTLQALMPGSAIVTVRDTATGISTSAPVVVKQVIAKINITPPEIAFDALGDTLTVSAVGEDRLGSVVPGAALEFSVRDAGLASFQSGSQLRSVALGQTLAIVTDPETGIVATADVQVTQRVAALTLTVDSIAFDALLDTSQVIVVGHDRLGSVVGDAAEHTTYVSTDPRVAVVSAGGAVHSVGNGAALIIAQSADGPADTVRVEVAQRVVEVVVDRDSLLFESLHAEAPVSGSARDRHGITVAGASIVYSVEDTTIARIDVVGLVHALGNGSTRVIAAAGGIDVPVLIRVAQRAVRVAVAEDTIRLSAIGDTASITGTALDSLGSPVAGQVGALVIADTAVVNQATPTTIRARRNGTTEITFPVAGALGRTIVDVRQIARTMTAALTYNRPIATLPVGASLPMDCQGYDANGFAVPDSPVLESTRSGTVTGGTCSDLRVVRSGYDTLVLASGSARATIPVVIAASPIASSRLGELIVADHVPVGPWSPSINRNASGDLEVYYSAYVMDSSVGYFRADLQRLKWLGGNAFIYDGVAITHEENTCDPQGQGIENVTIMPRAEGPGWRMLFAAGSFQCYGWQVFSAVSEDGRIWTKESGVRLPNGVTGPADIPPWPAGEGMQTFHLPNGEWQLIAGTFEHVLPRPIDQWAITEWRSTDQVNWTYRGTVLTVREMPVGWQGSVYSPTIREFAPGLWRMIFTADGRGQPGSRSALWSAVSTDRQHWQLEGELLGDPTSNLYYSSMDGEQLVFLRWDLGSVQRLAIATISMP